MSYIGFRDARDSNSNAGELRSINNESHKTPNGCGVSRVVKRQERAFPPVLLLHQCLIPPFLQQGGWPCSFSSPSLWPEHLLRYRAVLVKRLEKSIPGLA